MARRSQWRPWTLSERVIAPLLTGWTTVMAEVLREGGVHQVTTNELAEQDGDPSAGGGRQPRPAHDRHRGSLLQGAVRSTDLRPAIPQGQPAVLSSTTIALQKIGRASCRE